MPIAVFSILGIALGATLQYVFSRFLEERKQKRLLQTQAYADYLRSVAEATHLDSTMSEAQVHARIADARARIAMYGSFGVVKVLAEFERAGNATITEEQHTIFVRLIQAMRGDDKVESADLALVVLGSNAARPANKALERARR